MFPPLLTSPLLPFLVSNAVELKVPPLRYNLGLLNVTAPLNVVPVPMIMATDPLALVNVCAVEPVWVNPLKERFPELNPEPPRVIVLEFAKVDVPLLSPNNIPVLEPVELTTIF